MSPPLAAEPHRQALIEGLRDGTIDCIATDHAPHHPAEKEVPFPAAPNGVIGLETAFPALVLGLVEPGVVPLELIVERMTAGPARAFGLPRRASRSEPWPIWRSGTCASATTVSEDDLRSRSRNCAFLGREVQGRCLLTLAGGRIAHSAARGGGMSDVGLYLEDGTSWPGVSVGAPGAAVGEAVFTTAMTGYQEALTDPSYARQLLTFTAPMIGNYGIEDASSESRRVQATALICHEARNYKPNGREGLLDWLRGAGVVALSGLDTRALVRHLRDRGAMLGVACGEGVEPRRGARAARGRAADGGPAAGRRGVRASSTACRRPDARCHVVVLDYGAKASIVRLLEQAGRVVTVLPARRHGGGGRRARARRRAARQRARRSRLHGRARRRGARDGRPGPAALRHLPRPPAARPRARAGDVQAAVRPSRRQPPGASRRASGRVLVTSQNHGFAVRAPENGDGALEVTHRSLYDGTVEGLRLRGRPVWSMQFHPEASPGPHDAREKLAEFVEACAARAGGNG